MNIQPCFFFCGYNMPITPITTLPYPSLPQPYCLPLPSSDEDNTPTALPSRPTLLVPEEPSSPAKPRRRAVLDSEEELYSQEKRHYRKRRMHLAKRFVCEVQGCEKRFSSVIALRNHERKQHSIRRRELRAQQQAQLPPTDQ